MRYLVLITALFSSMAFGQIESIIQFNGQNADSVKINEKVSFVRQVPVEVPSTCTREVPYESYECRDVTRHRNECTWVPADQECWNEPENECRTVTRTRQECSEGPSRRVCTDIPRRQVCHDRPDRQECRSVTRYREECSSGSSREVCVERPTREVCRTDSRGQERCTTVGGGQSCHTVPGERSCHSVPYTDQECDTVDGGQDCTEVGGGETCHDAPGPQICRDVSYDDQECSTTYRRECRDIPAHEECRDIPYSENVCGNETRYRSESYACTRTEMQPKTIVKLLKGEIDVKFLTNGLAEEFPLSLVLSKPTKENQELTLAVALKKEPQVLVVKKRAVVKVKETETEIDLTGSAIIEVLEQKMVAPSFPDAVEASLDEGSKVLTLTVQGQLSAAGTVDLTIIRKKLLGKDPVVAQLKAAYPSEKVKLEGNKLMIDLAGELEGKLNKLRMDLTLGAAINVQGEVLNAKRPKLEESYQGIGIALE